MAEEGKKISFGFAKSIKKPILKSTVPQETKKVDYIECLDEKAIKVIGREEKKDEPLVIPLLGSKTWYDRIVNKIDADIFEPKISKREDEKSNENIKQEKDDALNGDASPIRIEGVKIKTEPSDLEEKPLTLEEQAAKEIIQDLHSNDNEPIKTEDLTLPLVADENQLRGKEESTIEDYDKIPVDVFGLAMLRGMGWQPGKGIGKNEKVVAAVVPELRPKGMGLGADKVALQKKPTQSKVPEEELKIQKGTFVKFIAGKQNNNYGEIEGLDDDAGRIIVKMALGGQKVSVNEFMVQPVTKSEYLKNAKVLNAKKYEEYKDKETNKPKKESSPEQLIISSSEDEDRRHRKEKKKSSNSKNDRETKTRKRHSSESDSNSNNGKKICRRSRSSSTESYKAKKSKKSKKHKRYDSSPERSSKKHKKDKERERTKNKNSRESEYVDRKKRKKHKRSRSRS